MSRRSIIILVASALVSIALIVGAILVIVHVGYYKIPQNGMYPALPAGAHLLVLKRPYTSAADVKRGDIVVFNQVLKDGKTYKFIWRVVALPGEHVKTEGDNLAINGQPALRERLRQASGSTIYRETVAGTANEIAIMESADEAPAADHVVPAGEFFVMGDNRRNALDSRYSGTVPFSSIVGRKW